MTVTNAAVIEEVTIFVEKIFKKQTNKNCNLLKGE